MVCVSGGQHMNAKVELSVDCDQSSGSGTAQAYLPTVGDRLELSPRNVGKGQI